MSNETLIYAVGAGHGHAVRGVVLGARAMEEGSAVRVIVRAGALAGVEGLPLGVALFEKKETDPLPSPEDFFPRAGRLIVDTFPNGWSDEISSQWLAQFRSRVFVARYRKDLNWAKVESQFDEIWLPYAESNNEWDNFPARAILIGPVAKPEPVKLLRSERDFVLYDPEGRSSQLLRQRIAELTEQVGLKFAVATKLTDGLSVRKLLAIGAGYNTFFELSRSGIDVRFMPVEKRFDDQHRRLSRAGLAVDSLAQLQIWLQNTIALRESSSQGASW